METLVLVVGREAPLHPAAWDAWEAHDPCVHVMVHSAGKAARKIPVAWEAEGDDEWGLLRETARALEYLCDAYQFSFDVFVVPHDALPCRRLDHPMARDRYQPGSLWGRRYAGFFRAPTRGAQFFSSRT